TPILLGAAMVAWVALWTIGIVPLVASLAASIVMVVGLLILERLMSRPGLDVRPAGTLRSDMAFTATTTLMAVVIPSVVIIRLGRGAATMLAIPSLWPAALPLWASAVLAVLVADLTSYWWHRLQHTTGESWLWRLHSVHHSPRHYDFWMG